MTKNDLIGAISRRTGLKRADSRKALDAFAEIITDELAGGGKVQITGFGTFEAVLRMGRQARNPLTGEFVQISTIYIPRFKPGVRLKERLKQVSDEIG